jgi:epoxyqueuosine reductase QueG
MNETEITRIIGDFQSADPRNTIPEIPGLSIFEEPLVAFAAAYDPLYAALSQSDVIGPHHRGPNEWLSGARSVVVWFLPFTERIVESNRPVGPPSEEWYLAYHWGETFNNALRDHVADEIKRAGHAAVAPMRDGRFLMQPGTSNWSERHTAYIAGMGSFGLSYSFITERGCAGRFGSVITDLDLPPSRRRVSSLRANCLAEGDGGCGVCISRCPVNAITAEKKEHAACLGFLRERVVPLYREKYGGIRSLCCGKCQTAVPCARLNPRKRK